MNDQCDVDAPRPYSSARPAYHELLHRFDEADLVLEQVLADSLSREELGLIPGDAKAGDD